MRLRRSPFVFACLLASAAVFSQTLKIATFNVERLGDGPGKDYATIARIVQRFDIVGCIGVSKPEAINDLMKHMGNVWKSFVAEHSVGTGLRQEYYAYMWRYPKLKMAQSLGYFKDPENVFVNKPYGAEFETSDSDFTLVLAHITAETSEMNEISHLAAVYNYFVGLASGGNVILGGDFGEARKPAFATLMEIDGLDDALGFSAKTTLGPRGLIFPSDHIFVNLFTKDKVVKAGEYNYVPDLVGGDYAKGRQTVSDHLPVYIDLKIGSD